MTENSSYIIGAALLVFLIVIGYLVVKSREEADNLDSYAVGNKEFAPLSVALALAASLTSAATFIINPGFIALYGVSGYLAFGVVMPIAIFIALVFLMKRFRKYGVTVKSLSIADWLGKRFDSRFLKLMFGFISLLLITFIVLICVGISKVLSKALHFDEIYVMIGLVIIVFGYMMLGGANAMIRTNTIQAVIMIVVAVILLGSDFQSIFESGEDGLFGKLAVIDPMLVQTFNPESPLFRDFFEVFICNAIVGIAIVCQPHILTKSLMIKDDKKVNTFLLYTILILILFFSVVFTGFYARAFFPDLIQGGSALQMDGIIPAYVVSRFPVYVTILLIIGLIAAGLSTLEGLIQSVPTTLTNDLILPLMKKNASDPKAIKINRWVTMIVALLTIVLSVRQMRSPDLSVAIFAQNGVYAFFSAAFVPVLFGIFTRSKNKLIPVTGALTALIVHFSVYYLEITWYMKDVSPKNPAIACAIALMVSVMVSGVIFLVLRIKHGNTEPQQFVQEADGSYSQLQSQSFK
ncbi:sodium:solute symporter family transporter [Robertkochia solimangrovi]|uniref:sodium:solute symporter family transporter n=1 Tax=Robertkochia solimangrovi TaxID=2213046 RepID=UPI00117D1FB8|nr:sodium:solute symporter [Robertkochia solimangrovi]TRZ43784.1 sodium:solute symporter [Robertkochia solimangrovi]